MRDGGKIRFIYILFNNNAGNILDHGVYIRQTNKENVYVDCLLGYNAGIFQRIFSYIFEFYFVYQKRRKKQRGWETETDAVTEREMDFAC